MSELHVRNVIWVVIAENKLKNRARVRSEKADVTYMFLIFSF